jgi:hypothetical protein
MLRFFALVLFALSLHSTQTDTLAKKAVYCTAGVALESGSLLARFGCKVSSLTPWASTLGKECLIISEVLDDAARGAFAQLSKDAWPSTIKSWHDNQKQLLEIPVATTEEKQMLDFLSHHFLSKVSGYFSVWVNWLCPSFDALVHIHPETTGFYARNPAIKFPEVYKRRLKAWKRVLDEPLDSPLILTRPFEIQDYLPSCVVDLTGALEEDSWEEVRARFLHECQGNICIQRIFSDAIGGIRVLSLDPKKAKKDHDFLLDWISAYGLSASRVELDRWPAPLSFEKRIGALSFTPPSKQEFLAYFESFEKSWDSKHAQKTLMVQGACQVIKGLFTSISENLWKNTCRSYAKSQLVQLCFSKIQKQLDFLKKNERELSFFELATNVELIHADLCALIEVFSPFTHADFPKIYADLMHWIPSSLKPLMTTGLHASGMTSMAGVFVAVKKLAGDKPRILFGENAYFELIHAAHLTGHATSIEDATPKDWEDVDLLLAQFNPALKRVNFQVTEYKLEDVAGFLKNAFGATRTKPLTLAVDCTFDYLNSSQIAHLLLEFQEKIESGMLNVICYRSGLKYDIFGMDSYCGAPFMMIHNQSAHWAHFSHLSSDPALKADILSLNWFCLVYKYAAACTESYRKQTFDNTQALLNALPQRLFDTNVRYRVIPMQKDANLGFIDIKVYGAFHQLRASCVVGGLLTTQCLKMGHPIFNRASVGFYHPNICILYAKECSTIRLTLGLDPTQIPPIVKCFEKLAHVL